MQNLLVTTVIYPCGSQYECLKPISLLADDDWDEFADAAPSTGSNKPQADSVVTSHDVGHHVQVRIQRVS